MFTVYIHNGTFGMYIDVMRGITTILFTQYTVQNRKLPPSLSGSTLLNPVIVFVRKVLTCE